MSGSRGLPLTYDQWVRRATLDAVPPNSDGLLHVGERAALIEQLSYLKKRNAQLMKQQRAVLLAACEAQAAQRSAPDFAGELMREKVLSEQRGGARRPGRRRGVRGVRRRVDGVRRRGQAGQEDLRRPRAVDAQADKPTTGGEYEASSAAGDDAAGDGDPAAGAAEMGEKLTRLEHENGELLRKTAVLVDYVRGTASMPRGPLAGPRDADDDFSDDDDDDDDDAELGLPPKNGQLAGSACLPEPVLFDEFAGAFGAKCKWESFMSGIVSAFGAPQGGSFPDEFDS
ncbi:hypothetical protein JL722_10725 [Aureococcus anophagefferens]|nr:hypothetical protein JL722_10725 [Aureococcus anophagefferens]